MLDCRQARQRGRNERPPATGASGQPPSLWRGEARACGVTNVAEEAATAEIAAGGAAEEEAAVEGAAAKLGGR